MSDEKGYGKSWESVLKSAVSRDQKEIRAAVESVSTSSAPRSGSGTWLGGNALVLAVIAAIVLFLWYRHR